jgi:hypothetical protein
LVKSVEPSQRRKPMTGPSRLISLAAVLASLALTAPALAQPKATTLSGVWDDPYVGEVKQPEGIDKLRAAVMAASKMQRTRDAGCYPMVFTVSAGRGGDPRFIEDFANERVMAVRDALTNKLTLDPKEFEVRSEPGFSDDVQVTYGGGDSTEPPVLKVTWDPPTGSKVSLHQDITVKINMASERFEDGHKTWPTGIKLIQVRDELNDKPLTPYFEDHSLVPDLCARRDLTVHYKVNADGPIVLTVMAENGVGRHNFDTATYSTRDWYGTINAHVHGSPGPYDDTAEIAFSFDEAQDGALQGRAHAKMTNAPSPAADDCFVTHTQEPSELDFAIGGRLVDDEFRLDIPTNLKAKIQFTADKCQHGPNPRTYPTDPFEVGFFSAMAPPFYQPKVRAHDGAKNTISVMLGVQLTEATIELHQAAK